MDKINMDKIAPVGIILFVSLAIIIIIIISYIIRFASSIFTYVFSDIFNLYFLLVGFTDTKSTAWDTFHLFSAVSRSLLLQKIPPQRPPSPST
ncbi:uncharacterized protein F4807DRAFT_424118 [Annulohypoxylon truncatum]|uniref:uncharacterized protein n=1 Tax=Annulohypoxylon truncatum TaxID=327061 RepID=UPI0020081F07|nr:uncharacterized protein F4807DRAFT_424118 [Annulohypoxylon truncatum]KAI1210177.1 hypothetical protein F4807DRAFT_424118 [Annulohypoxylon truncatum]